MACTELIGWLYKICPDTPLDNFLYIFINYILPIMIIIVLFIILIKIKNKKTKKFR